MLITNNRFGPDWRRERLDEGVLEILIAENAGALAKLKASADLVTGGWRESEGIRSIVAREVTISRPPAPGLDRDRRRIVARAHPAPLPDRAGRAQCACGGGA